MTAIVRRSQIEDALDAAGIFSDGDDTIRTDYSGRAMYGATCFGIVAGANQTTAILMAMGAHVDDWVDLAAAARTDSMGLDTITYFPGWQLDDAGDDGYEPSALTVRIYDGTLAGLDTEAGRWQVVCETHGAILSVETRDGARREARLARRANGCEWCEDCMDGPDDGAPA